MEAALICVFSLVLLALCSAFYFKPKKAAPVYSPPPVQVAEPV